MGQKLNSSFDSSTSYPGPGNYKINSEYTKKPIAK